MTATQIKLAGLEGGASAPSDAGASIPALGLAPASTPNALKYTKEDFQRVTKLYMDLFFKAQAKEQAQAQVQANRPDQSPLDHPLKARLPDFCYGKSHIRCYHFC